MIACLESSRTTSSIHMAMNLAQCIPTQSHSVKQRGCKNAKWFTHEKQSIVPDPCVAVVESSWCLTSKRSWTAHQPEEAWPSAAARGRHLSVAPKNSADASAQPLTNLQQGPAAVRRLPLLQWPRPPALQAGGSEKAGRSAPPNGDSGACEAKLKRLLSAAAQVPRLHVRARTRDRPSAVSTTLDESEK